MPYSGSCSCGNIKFEVDGEPLQIALCHCLQCRKLTGTAYTTNFLIPISSLKVVSGNLKHNSFVQESGIAFKVSFCGDCSSPLGKETDDQAFKGLFILAAGLLDTDFGKLKPTSELWVKHRAEWLPPLADAQQAQTFV